MAIRGINVWRTAQYLVTLHGPLAPMVAAQRLKALLATRDFDGRIAWRRIGKAVDVLLHEQAVEPVENHTRSAYHYLQYLSH